MKEQDIKNFFRSIRDTGNRFGKPNMPIISPEVQRGFRERFPQLPSEIMKAFEERRPVKEGFSRVFPEFLLAITHEPLNTVTRRIYHTPVQEGDRIFFNIAAKTTFQPRSVRLELFGEGGGKIGMINGIDVTSVEFHRTQNATLEKCNLSVFRRRSVKASNKAFDIEFHENGLISQVRFGHSESPLSKVPLLKQETLNQLFAVGLLKVAQPKDVFGNVREDIGSFTFAIVERQITLIRFDESGKEEDILTLPPIIDTRRIMQTLFDPNTLRDPFNAPPELDHWCLMNPMEVFGITWGEKL